MITNQTGINGGGSSTAGILHDTEQVELVALFSPEHGSAGTLEQSVIADARDPTTGLTIHSLHGEARRPTKQSLQGIDTLVFDIQDVGTRFYAVAVPPTLTIFVQSDSIDLDQLTIPRNIVVTRGYVPTVFHRSNTTIERKREEENARNPNRVSTKPRAEDLDAAAEQAADGIRASPKKRAEQDREPTQD